MTANYVEIRVKASDTAKPDLTSLKAQLAEIGSTVENARVDVDDEDGKARLLDFNARLAALNAKVANPKISLAGAARAEAQIVALDAQLRKSSDDSAGAKTSFGAFGQAVNALTLGLSGGIGEMTMFQKVMFGLNVATGLGEPLVAGLTVAVAGLASGLVSAGGAAGAFGLLAKSNLTTAATAATAAQSAQTQYSSAVTAANAAYERQMKTATTATERKNAETARATALQSAYKAQVQATTAAYAQLTPAQVQLSRQVGAIQNQWQKFTASFAGPTSAIVGQIRPLVTSLLPDISKLAMAGETGISSLLSTVGAAGTGGLGKFVTMLSANAPAAIVRLGVAVGHVATGIGGILRAFMPVQSGLLSGLDAVTAKFAKWGQTLSGHSGFQSLMSTFRTETPMAVSALKQLAALIKTVVASMAGMSTFSNSKMLLQGLNLLLPVLNKLAKVPGLVNLILYMKLAAEAGGKLKVAIGGIGDAVGGIKSGAAAFSSLRKGMSDAEAAASDATGAWGTFGGRISAVVSAIKGWTIWSKIAAGATKVWTGIQAAFDVVMDANPIGIIIIAIAALVAAIVILTIKFKFMREFWKAAWADIKAVAVAAWHLLEAGFRAMVTSVEQDWRDLMTVIKFVIGLVSDYIRMGVSNAQAALAWFGRLGSLFRGWWDDAANAVVSVEGQMIAFVRGIPGRILGALGNLGSLLFSAGRNVIQGLINGITSMVGSVGSAIGHIAGEITSHLPFSPAKKGPLSGSGSPDRAGARIAQMLAAGMTSALPSVTTAAGRMAGSAGLGGGRVAGAAGGALTVQLEWAGGGADDLLLRWIRRQVRIHGGSGPDSVQKTFGRN